MDGNVDLVISGINRGPNLGWDVHYSGTVSAAIEASVMGKQSFAISVTSFDEKIYWETAAEFALKLASWVEQNPLPDYTVLNVNVPNVPPCEVRGTTVASLGRRQYVDVVDRRLDPLGREYYWLGGSISDENGHDKPDSDVAVIADNRISVTPLQLDMTAHDLLPSLSSLVL